MYKTKKTITFFIFLFFCYQAAFSFVKTQKDSSELERVFVYLHLQNVQDLDSNIKVDLRYASTRNFLKTNMYGNIHNAYLQKDVAKQLSKAQKYLKDSFPQYSLIIFDAARPVSVQQYMWDHINVPLRNRSKYLSNPKFGSMHNYGAAVDLSIIDENGKLLDMKTDFDSFEKIAYPFYEKKYLQLGKLTQQQYNNRKLLRYVMKKAGFNSISTEWWHFSLHSRKYAHSHYTKIISANLNDYINKSNKKEKTLLSKNIANINTDNLIYRIQIYTSKKERNLKWKRLKGAADYYYFHKNLYKYTSGIFKTIQAANHYKNKMRAKGFKGSFVVPFYKGKRISLKEADNLLQ